MKHYRIVTLILLGVFIVTGIVSPLRSSVALASGLNQSTTPGPNGQNAADWAVSFSDEFNGTSLDTNKWRLDYWNGGNGELQEYVNDNSRNNYIVGNGMLRIVARKESYNGKSYTSGAITTQERFFQKQGFFEIRAKMPVGKGLWPAFWLMPNPSGWPPELDILEYLGHQKTTAHMTVHYKNSSGSNSSDGSYYTGPDFSADWHTFGLKWDSTSLVWYIDGVERKRVTDSIKIPTVSMFILANMAVGGSWPGNPDSSTVFPAYYDIDYIRVWKRSSGTAPTATPVPTKAPTAAPTTAPTTAPSGNQISNASFEDQSLSPWVTRNDLGATFSQDTSTASAGLKSAKVSLSSSNSSQPWVVALQQHNKSLTSGQTYTVAFWAKASQARSIKAIVQAQNSPYTEYFNQTVNLGTSWTRYSYTFTASASTSAAMLNFNLAAATGTVWIDDVGLCAGSTACNSTSGPAPAPTSTPAPAPTATPGSQNDLYLPTIRITYPANNAQVPRNTVVTIKADASDNVGIAKVEFRVKGVLVCTDTTVPYECPWTVPNTTNTQYKIEAKAYDLSDNRSVSTIKVFSK